MGLAARKQKQRIPADPRNLSWADDASRFGLSYLSKFGWDASQGLGSSGEGMKSHLKVQQKLDMMGIGAQHQRDPGGIAWKQNKDFEALLKRLNDNAEEGEEGDEEGGRKTALGNAFVGSQEEKAERKLKRESSQKKRTNQDGGDPDISKKARKRAKKEKEKHEKSGLDVSAVPAIDRTSEPLPKLSESTPKSRPMAHRARIRAAKRLAGKSASAIAEILGIAPSSSASTSTPAGTPPPPSIPDPQPSHSLDNLTTSTKSVADYFKEKLLARCSSSSSPASSSTPSGSATPGPGATSPPDSEGELSRGGIGSRTPVILLSSHTPDGCLAPVVTNSEKDGSTEKQRRKAERKASKRKRHEVDPTVAVPEGKPIAVEVQIEVLNTQRVQEASKRETKHRDRKEQALANQCNDDDGAIERGRDTEFRRAHKKRRS